MITADEILGFIRERQAGALLRTLDRQTHFSVELRGTTIVCMRDHDELRKISLKELEKYLVYANFLMGEKRFVLAEYPENWQSRSYFVSILKHAMEAAWGHEHFLPEECSEPEQFTEGARATITVNRYERDRNARDECIAEHGAICCVCRVPMTRIYGPEAVGLIHVHHRKSLSSIGKEYKVDPKHDLLPVCPNCHAFIHWNRLAGDERDPDEVTRIIERHRRDANE